MGEVNLNSALYSVAFRFSIVHAVGQNPASSSNESGRFIFNQSDNIV